MKAITYDTYGSPDILTMTEVDAPTPGEGEVLVKVRAAGINPYDWHMYRGEPYLIRPQMGVNKPKQRVTVGADFAGEVAAVGAGVTGVSVGDRVLANVGQGACAEFAIAEVGQLAAMPADMTYEHAAALPMGALTALQGLRDVAKLQPGERVLVNGGSGGVGNMAVQIAKTLGAGHVTAVCSGKNAAWVRETGADDVVDYTQQDFTSLEARYDVVYDTVGTKGVRGISRILSPGGRFAIAGSKGMGKLLGPASFMMGSVLAGMFMKPSAQMVSARSSGADLAIVAQWAQEGLVKAHIDRTFPLAKTADAMRFLEEGHVAGKVVITVP